MTTAARPQSRTDSHWYSTTGEPRYEILGKTTNKMRPVTIRDAKENNWVPSVTNILKLLHKEALVNWMIEQAVLACLTAPRKEGEAIDAFVERVLHEEKQQSQEAKLAADKGTEIHNALEDYFLGQEVAPDIRPWILPVAEEIAATGNLVAAEKILVGDGYAGKTDLIIDSPECWWLWDFKSTKTLPDLRKGGAYPEHRLQLSAYAKAYEELIAGDPQPPKPIRTANAYISTVEEGKFVISRHEDWQTVYFQGFAPLVTHWQWANKYRPEMPGRMNVVKAPEQTKAAVEAVKEAAEKRVVVDSTPKADVVLLKGKHVVYSQSLRIK